MPPKNSNAAVERPFNLTENEINFTVHACKLLVQDGKVDRFTLAEATGKGNPETAKRMWSQIKNKMGVNANSLAAYNGAVEDGVTPAKPATKRKGGGATTKKRGKKRAKKDNIEEAVDSEEEICEVKEENREVKEEEDDEDDVSQLV